MVLRFSLLRVLSLLCFFLLSTGPTFCNGQYEGESCKIDQSPGVCSRLEQCPQVYEDLLKGIPPQSMCGYSYFDPIVCCPVNRPIPIPMPAPEPDPTPGTFISDRGDKARAKCEEYSRSVYAFVTPPTLDVNRKPVNVSLCALKTRKLIVGGKKAEPKEFPHMVAVGFNSGDGGIAWLCGGTLISERFVLTAAHCTYNLNFKEATWVRVGDLNLERTNDDAKPQDIQITERIRHPSYKKPSEYHDIALLKLETNVQFNEWVRPSCLPYSLPDTGTDNKATATGWGRVDWAEDTSSDLLKVTINLVPTSKCNSTFMRGQRDAKLKYGIVDDWQICAGEPGKDTCQGDSGGPLVILNNDYNCMYTLIGVTSLGKICGSIIPGVYTRVYNYVPWIESVVWPSS
nr:serine protease snake-like [Osmia lignaria]